LPRRQYEKNNMPDKTRIAPPMTDIVIDGACGAIAGSV
jgi:hypothetical protein